jgi:cation diffusion facilitator CzcD-associated flavoprotein CzcO
VEQPRIAIVGTGFGGIGMACELKRHGYTDITLFERGSEIGGVWSANTYPGAACDVPAQLYSLSFAPNPRWSGNFPPQAEIRAYIEKVADDFGIRPLIRFGTTVRAAVWADRSWTLTLDPGGRETFDVVLFAVGQLSAPSWPAIPGREEFTGTTFHSAHWDHDAPLQGRRIGVIGTGASAIQFVPHLARVAAHLTLFQRSAPFIMPKHTVTFDRGALRDLFGRSPVLQRFSRAATYLFYESRALGFTVDARMLKVVEKANERLLAKQVSDPDLRAQLRPTDPVGCKRVLLSNDYYPAVAGPEVTLTTERIARITPTGVRTEDGIEHELDVLVYGTGFTANEFLAGIEVRGAAGTDIHEHWAGAGGAQSFRGGTVAGFPNMVLLYGPNTNLGHNSIVYMLESQFRHVLALLEAMRDRAATVIEPRPAAESAWNEWVAERMAKTVFVAGCDSWYANAAGKQTNNWPGFTPSYRRGTQAADPADYVFT